jgi:hypothetical protein
MLLAIARRSVLTAVLAGFGRTGRVRALVTYCFEHFILDSKHRNVVGQIVEVLEVCPEHAPSSCDERTAGSLLAGTGVFGLLTRRIEADFQCLRGDGTRALCFSGSADQRAADER